MDFKVGAEDKNLTQSNPESAALRESQARQMFLLELGDALRLLADAEQIQATATRILGKRLDTNRVAYFEVNGADYVVRRDFTNGVPSLVGTYPVESFGAHLPAIYRIGQTALSHNVANDVFLPPADRAAHLAVQIAAFVGVPLIKDGKFVGGLTAHENRARQWTIDEIAIIEETAERTWAAVERARAEEALRISERETKRARDYAEAILRTSPVPLIVLESDLSVATANEAFYEAFRVEPAATVGRPFLQLGNGQWKIPHLRKLLEEILGHKTALKNFEVSHDFESLGRRTMLLNARRMENESDAPERIVLVIEDISERKRAEMLLRESEARLASEAQALLNLNNVSSKLWLSRDLSGGLQEMLQATIGMLGADMGNVQVMNSKGMLNIAAQQGFQREFLDYFYEVATDKDCACGRALRSGERIMIEDVETDAPYAPFRAAARRAGYRTVQSTPLLSRSGAPLGMISTHWRAPHVPSVHDLRRLDLYARQAADFVERFRNDEAARQARERFDIVKDSTQVGFWFCDLPFEKLEWDNRVKEHFWLPPEAEVTIDTFYERMHPEDREPTRRAIEVSIAKQTPYETEYRTLSPDARVKWIRAIGRGFYDENGQPIRFDGVTLDITGRKRAEELLRDSEAQLAAATVAGSIGTWAWELSSNVLTANPALARAFGMDVEQVRRGLPAEAYISAVLPEDQPAIVEAINRAMAPDSDGVYAVEYRTRDADGKVRWLFSRGRVEFDAQRKPVRMPGALTDITDRKDAEEALRTAKERAEAANRSKDDFLAALSHELRTPLTPVLMTAATLKDDSRLSDDIREQLAMMERNIALEARLIDDLLDLTAISHGKLKMRLERCDLNTIIERAIEMVAPDSTAKNLAISRDFSAPQHLLMADFTRLQQVVWNLLRNAVKFTPPGGKISIRTRETTKAENNRWLMLEIADTGIGIEPSHIAQIFRPFDQGSLSGNHRFGGLGLGLTIARAVVVAHGGGIEARSEGVGRGATFVVELPHAAPLANYIPASSQKSLAKIIPLRLLLVEDHESTLQTLAKLLQRDGHQVTTAMTIASALTVAALGTFDFVISDLGLPDGSGSELMSKLRSLYGLKGIALSGYGMEEDLVRSREAGFVAHLVKPVAIDDLRRAIENLTTTHRQGIC